MGGGKKKPKEKRNWRGKKKTKYGLKLLKRKTKIALKIFSNNKLQIKFKVKTEIIGKQTGRNPEKKQEKPGKKEWKGERK